VVKAVGSEDTTDVVDNLKRFLREATGMKLDDGCRESEGDDFNPDENDDQWANCSDRC